MSIVAATEGTICVFVCFGRNGARGGEEGYVANVSPSPFKAS